jgi:hypothetical protein
MRTWYRQYVTLDVALFVSLNANSEAWNIGLNPEMNLLGSFKLIVYLVYYLGSPWSRGLIIHYVIYYFHNIYVKFMLNDVTAGVLSC